MNSALAIPNRSDQELGIICFYSMGIMRVSRGNCFTPVGFADDLEEYGASMANMYAVGDDIITGKKVCIVGRNITPGAQIFPVALRTPLGLRIAIKCMLVSGMNEPGVEEVFMAL